MPLAREQRKLAAIVAADVVGYSRLMGRDESGTLTRLRKNRSEHLDPVVTKYGGRLVKLTGDGALIEFASAVDALSAAILATFRRKIEMAWSGVVIEWRAGNCNCGRGRGPRLRQIDSRR